MAPYMDWEPKTSTMQGNRLLGQRLTNTLQWLAASNVLLPCDGHDLQSRETFRDHSTLGSTVGQMQLSCDGRGFWWS